MDNQQECKATGPIPRSNHRRRLIVGLVFLISIPCLLIPIRWINRNMKSQLNEELLTAVKADNVELARELLNRGADPNTRLSPKGMSCLFLARAKMAEALLAHGADPSIVDEDTGYQAIHCVNDSETAKVLIRHGADVNAFNGGGFTPLHVISDSEVGHVLIENGAVVNACTIDGDTPLDLAIADNRNDFAEMLLAHGARSYDDLDDDEVQSSPFWLIDGH